MTITRLLNWFTGEGRYMTLFHCMGKDMLWISITVALDVLVATGYVLIARHWWINQRVLPDSPAKRALGSMRNIFIFCGICGYLFIPIKMFWPAWRLYDIVVVGLVYTTWRYALNAKNLGVVYSELTNSARLARDLADSQADVKRKRFFLNAISHDLRTPLNGLILSTDLARISLEAGDTETLESSLAQIKSSTRMAADLLNDFLELGRLEWNGEKNRVSSFDLAAFLTHVVEANASAAGAGGLTITVEHVPGGVQVRTDRVKLERALLNLVGNAIKFTRQGGVEVSADFSGDDLCIHVTDTGVGIRADDQALLFHEFYQVDNNERDRRKGFGLGLAIAKRVVEQLDGAILVRSEVGRGSRFTIRLPAAAAVPETAQPGREIGTPDRVSA